MKYTLTILFLTLFSSLWSQDWDTVYTDDENVEIKIEISYYNCFFVNIDTVYRLTTFDTDPVNRRLFHSTSKVLLFERKVSNDTTYCYGYYHSGKIKMIDISHRNEWLHHSTFYENGQLQSGGDIYADKLYPWNRYYPNGNVLSKGFRYDYLNTFGPYEEFHPNGQLACSINYSLPDTTISFYQQSKLIDEVYFDIEGNKTDSSGSVINVITEYLQPKLDNSRIEKIDSLFTHHYVSDQEGFNNNLKDLKREIKRNLKIPKSCNCSTGIAWIGFIVCKDGTIKMIEVDFPNDCLKRAIEKSIQKTKKWKTAFVENEKVDVYVYTFLIVE